MRRIVLWSVGTVGVVALLFGYRTSTEGPGGAPAAVPAISGGNPGAGRAPRASTVFGDAAETQFGPVQVELTLAGGRIARVDVPVYPDETSEDQQIASFALPRLIQETISAQSAKIDMVSGATYTSEGYLHSLQSALDKAGVVS